MIGRPRPNLPSLVRGLSIVELMVGVAIGLFILAGATLVATTQLSDNRRMLLENQVNQDLRAALDIIARDLRRAGYWFKAASAVWPQSAAAALDNRYVLVSAQSDQIEYWRSQDERMRCGGKVMCGGYDYPDDRDPDENAGFRFDRERELIEMLVSEGNWQALTDPAVMKVTDFSIDLRGVQSLDVPCTVNCPTLGPKGCPLKLRVRNAIVTLTAQAVHDPNVVRSAKSVVRLRNDVVVEEAC